MNSSCGLDSLSHILIQVNPKRYEQKAPKGGAVYEVCHDLQRCLSALGINWEMSTGLENLSVSKVAREIKLQLLKALLSFLIEKDTYDCVSVTLVPKSGLPVNLNDWIFLAQTPSQ